MIFALIQSSIFLVLRIAYVKGLCTAIFFPYFLFKFFVTDISFLLVVIAKISIVLKLDCVNTDIYPRFEQPVGTSWQQRHS